MPVRVTITWSNVHSSAQRKTSQEKTMIIKTSAKAGMKEVISTHIGGG